MVPNNCTLIRIFWNYEIHIFIYYCAVTSNKGRMSFEWEKNVHLNKKVLRLSEPLLFFSTAGRQLQKLFRVFYGFGETKGLGIS